ncbi:hypothetical protein PRZ61_12425 [Halomonas pacifica]|uniref:hypothetical protein n=1 Tax=Bisbaumannia pacifica TaxID=77098 RepID=UPI002358F4C3|nr:hypothetical protein [Halomonas pacifica]MDC8804247.1 hypothetical protein [Halomonas pacifica]
MTTYPDAVLDYYADRFQLLGLARAGISLAQYLAHPQHCEQLARFDRLRLAQRGMTFQQYRADPEAGERLALEPEPPLDAQHAAILRLWAAQDTGLAPRPNRVEPHWSDAHLTDWRELQARWRAECEALERDIAHLPQRNGTYVEPLHHHRHERNGRSHFTPNQRGA